MAQLDSFINAKYRLFFVNRILKVRPEILLIIGAFLISFSSVFVKISHVSPLISAFYRVFFGGLCLLPACMIKKDFKKRGLKNNAFAAVCGFLFALDLGAWHLSIHYIGPGLATILANFQVFILSFAGILFFKERLTLQFALSVPAAFLGLFLLIGLDVDQLSDQYYWGVVYGLAAALFYSLFLLLMRRLQSDAIHFSLFYYQMVFSFICAGFLGVAAFFLNNSFVIPDGQTLAALIGLGAMNQAFAWVLITSALPKVKASHAGLILLLQPSLSFIWDVWFFDRITGSIGWVGFFIVLIAIYSGMSNKKD